MEKQVAKIRIYEDLKIGYGCAAHSRIMADVYYSVNGKLVPTTIIWDVVADRNEVLSHVDWNTLVIDERVANHSLSLDSDLESLIPSAESVLMTTKKTGELKLEIERINKRIAQAKSDGKRRTCFLASIDTEPILKELYQKKGFKFCPTGEIGGVWQKSIDIFW